MTLAEAASAIGRRVIYRPTVGPAEPGVITSVNETFVFVRYDSSKHSAATRPEDLELMRFHEEEPNALR